MTFYDKDNVWLTAPINNNNVALLDGKTFVPQTAFSTEVALTTGKNDIASLTDTWHHRFNHVGYDRLYQLAKKGLVKGLPSSLPKHHAEFCRFCLAGKQTREPFPDEATRRTGVLDLVHSDLKTNLPNTATGYKHWITFTDDASRYRSTYLLRLKSEAFDAFKSYKAWAERQTGRKIKALRDDKGGEYISNEWNELLDWLIEVISEVFDRSFPSR